MPHNTFSGRDNCESWYFLVVVVVLPVEARDLKKCQSLVEVKYSTVFCTQSKPLVLNDEKCFYCCLQFN